MPGAPPGGAGPTGVLSRVAAAARDGPGSSVLAVLGCPQPVVDLLADGADGELLGVAPGDPDLAAQGHHRVAGQGALEDLLLAHVVREALVVAGLLQLLLDLLALQHGGGRRGAAGV